MKQINEFRGLWDLNDIPIKLKKFETEKDKKLALKMQLHFRQKVLRVRYNRSLFAMTSGGEAKDILTIIGNLKGSLIGSMMVNQMKILIYHSQFLFHR